MIKRINNQIMTQIFDVIKEGGKIKRNFRKNKSKSKQTIRIQEGHKKKQNNEISHNSRNKEC